MQNLFVIFILFIFSLPSYAYELVTIQATSKSKRTFVTRLGKENGVNEGKMATFTANNVALIAKAIEVNRDFTLWEVENEEIDLPFKKGDVITYHNAEEYLWTLNTEKTRQKYLKDQAQRSKNNLSLNTTFIQGLSETVENADSDSVRGGLNIDTYFEREINFYFRYFIGLRFAREQISTEAVTLTNDKFILQIGIGYYFAPIVSWGNTRFGLSLALGTGQSQTTTEAVTSSGTTTLLPATKIHANIPLSKNYEFIIESAFENYSTQEQYESGEKYRTNSNNLRYGVGIRRYF